MTTMNISLPKALKSFVDNLIGTASIPMPRDKKAVGIKGEALALKEGRSVSR